MVSLSPWRDSNENVILGNISISQSKDEGEQVQDVDGSSFHGIAEDISGWK